MKYRYIIERRVGGKYQDCFENDKVGAGTYGLHKPPNHQPRWGNLFSTEAQAQAIADELNSPVGLGKTAKPGRYMVADFRPNSGSGV